MQYKKRHNNKSRRIASFFTVILTRNAVIEGKSDAST